MMERAPWNAEDLRRYVLQTAVALGLCVVAWVFASDRATAQAQMPYLSLSVGGLLVGGYASLRWLASGRRRLRSRRDAMLARFEVGPPEVTAGTTPRSGAPSETGYVGGRGRMYFHHPGCPMARGRDWPVRDREEHERAGRRPCGICLT